MSGIIAFGTTDPTISDSIVGGTYPAISSGAEQRPALHPDGRQLRSRDGAFIAIQIRANDLATNIVSSCREGRLSNGNVCCSQHSSTTQATPAFRRGRRIAHRQARCDQSGAADAHGGYGADRRDGDAARPVNTSAGYAIWKLDGRPDAALFQDRNLAPLQVPRQRRVSGGSQSAQEPTERATLTGSVNTRATTRSQRDAGLDRHELYHHAFAARRARSTLRGRKARTAPISAWVFRRDTQNDDRCRRAGWHRLLHAQRIRRKQRHCRTMLTTIATNVTLSAANSTLFCLIPYNDHGIRGSGNAQYFRHFAAVPFMRPVVDTSCRSLPQSSLPAPHFLANQARITDHTFITVGHGEAACSKPALNSGIAFLWQ